MLFDAAETLFTTRASVGEIYSEVAARFGARVSPVELQAAFSRAFRHSGPVRIEDEKRWWKAIVHEVFVEVGMIQDFDRFFDEVYAEFRDSSGWRLYPETRSVLETLRSRGLKLGVVSNFDSRLHPVMKGLGLSGLVDSVTISSETGYAKPSAEIFEAAIRAIRVPPGRVLFVGDSLSDDYQGGVNAGLQTLLLDREDRYSQMKSIPRIHSLLDVAALLS